MQSNPQENPKGKQKKNTAISKVHSKTLMVLKSIFAENYALGNRSDFFNALSEVLNNLLQVNIYREMSLRNACSTYYADHTAEVDGWNQNSRRNFDPQFHYLNIVYTLRQAYPHQRVRAILGIPEIEGRMICAQLSINALYIIHDAHSTQRIYQMVTEAGIKQIGKDEFKLGLSTAPCLVQSGVHFTPLYPTAIVNRCDTNTSSSSSDTDDEESDSRNSNGDLVPPTQRDITTQEAPSYTSMQLLLGGGLALADSTGLLFIGIAQLLTTTDTLAIGGLRTDYFKDHLYYVPLLGTLSLAGVIGPFCLNFTENMKMFRTLPEGILAKLTLLFNRLKAQPLEHLLALAGALTEGVIVYNNTAYVVNQFGQAFITAPLGLLGLPIAGGAAIQYLLFDGRELVEWIHHDQVAEYIRPDANFFRRLTSKIIVHGLPLVAISGYGALALSETYQLFQAILRFFEGFWRHGAPTRPWLMDRVAWIPAVTTSSIGMACQYAVYGVRFRNVLANWVRDLNRGIDRDGPIYMYNALIDFLKGLFCPNVSEWSWKHLVGYGLIGMLFTMAIVIRLGAFGESYYSLKHAESPPIPGDTNPNLDVPTGWILGFLLPSVIGAINVAVTEGQNIIRDVLRIKSVHRTVSESIFHGLEFQTIPGDGHCLFRAVGLYLNQDPLYLRRIVAAHLEENAQDYRAFRPPGTEEAFSAYLENLRNGKEWGDHIEIQVLQRLTDRPIIIIRPNANPTIPDDLDYYHGVPIFLYYNDRDHYDVFILREGYDSRQILNSIQEKIQQGQRVTYRNNTLTQFSEHSLRIRSASDDEEQGVVNLEDSVRARYPIQEVLEDFALVSVSTITKLVMVLVIDSIDNYIGSVPEVAIAGGITSMVYAISAVSLDLLAKVYAHNHSPMIDGRIQGVDEEEELEQTLVVRDQNNAREEQPIQVLQGSYGTAMGTGVVLFSVLLALLCGFYFLFDRLFFRSVEDNQNESEDISITFLATVAAILLITALRRISKKVEPSPVQALSNCYHSIFHRNYEPIPDNNDGENEDDSEDDSEDENDSENPKPK